MVPTTVCLLPLCQSVWMHAFKRVMAHMYTVALFRSQLPPHPHSRVSSEGSLECVCCVSQAKGCLWPFVCLTLVALVPPQYCRTKTVVFPVTKAAPLCGWLCLSSCIFSHTLDTGLWIESGCEVGSVPALALCPWCSAWDGNMRTCELTLQKIKAKRAWLLYSF